MTLNETNCDWLFDMPVKWPHGRALANERNQLFQTFSHQSEGLATRDYNEHSSHHLLLTSVPLKMQWITFVFEGNDPPST